MGGRYNSLNEVQGAMFKENFEINIYIYICRESIERDTERQREHRQSK